MRGMMREILFRGIAKTDVQRCKRGQWVYGDLVRLQDGNDGKPHIYGYGEVFPETVGQYIGICDKNGQKIFEGDIIVIRDGGMIRKYIVEYEEGNTAYYANAMRGERPIGFQRLVDDNSDEYEVIGNIYDNSELLKGGEG